MTAADPEHPSTRTGSAPRARISHAALAANARAGVASVPSGDRIADLRYDALGHGAAACARTLADAGVDAVIADADLADAVTDAAAGRLRVMTDGEPTLATAALYGLDGVCAPVMRLSGTVLGIKPLRAGEGVSYGYIHRAAHDTRVALVTGGYAQGVVRALGERANVRVGGALHPIIGRVAMDVCVVDVQEAEIRRGDPVVFFGDPASGEPSLQEWVRSTGMTAAELVAMVGARVRRDHE
ncbi:alanine racemase C-terminal domain-containing protein [Microbacterium immunditiarum]|uniref:Alanine racemase n=1 Tax=Microbacterium immunditiarum TaxID=337480 RepID=A0A7Y9GRW6_9MICO|nr:alanine racemase [Microbacterium immunditiarum]